MADPIDPKEGNSKEGNPKERLVRSVHPLMIIEREILEASGKDPKGYVALPLGGTFGFGQDAQGNFVLTMQAPLSPVVFKALAHKGLVGADGVPGEVKKLATQITLPPNIRLIMPLTALTENSRTAIEKLLLAEGMPIFEAEEQGLLPAPRGPVIPLSPGARIPEEA